METDSPPPPPPPPHLPIPPLDETLDAYLDNLKPILSTEKWKETSAQVSDFRQKHGERLQKRLEERQAELENWAYDWWLEDMYLKVGGS